MSSIRICPTRRPALVPLVLAVAVAAAPAARAGEPAPIDRVVAEALHNNPEIRAARSERAAAAHRIAPAGALDDPMMEMGVLNVPTRSFSFSREDMTMKMLGLSQRLPYPGKRELRRGVAEQDAATVGHGLQETINRVVRDTKSAYHDLALALGSHHLVEQNRAILLELMKIADTRYSVGQATQLDVLRAQTQVSRMNEELIRHGRDIPMFQVELARLTGRADFDATHVTRTVPLGEVALSFEALRDQAWRERPQLLGLQGVVARNGRAIELARKDQYPDFDVRLAYGLRENMPDGTRRSDMVSLTVAMNLPVWRQAKTDPKIAEAIAMQQQAESLYEAQRNETAAKLRQQIIVAEQNLRSAKLYAAEILPQSKLAVEAATAAYQVGRGDFAALLDNQMAILNAQVAHASAVAGYHKALAEIDFLTGAGTTAAPPAGAHP